MRPDLTYAYNVAGLNDAGSNGITTASGGRFANAALDRLGLCARYDLPVIRSTIGFGTDYVDERDSLDSQHVKPYAVFDMSRKMQWQQRQLHASVRKPARRGYTSSGFIERIGSFPSERRRLYVHAAYAF